MLRAILTGDKRTYNWDTLEISVSEYTLSLALYMSNFSCRTKVEFYEEFALASIELKGDYSVNIFIPLKSLVCESCSILTNNISTCFKTQKTQWVNDLALKSFYFFLLFY